MNWLEFFASLIASLAWPTALIVSFFLIKRHLGQIFPFVEKLKYKDFELHFRQAVHELVVRSRTALPERANRTPLPSTDRLYALAEVSARSAIFEAWLEVEFAAIDALQRLDTDLSLKAKSMAPLRLGELLVSREILGQDQIEIFHKLRELRNAAIHIKERLFQSEEVAEYISLATALASVIRSRGLGV